MAVDPAVDLAIAKIAARQDGQVTAAQLTRAGLTRSALRSRLEHGYLVRLARGVFGLGAATQVPWALERTALLALGDGALISDRSAGALFAIRDYPASGPVTLAVTGPRRRARPGLVVHRTGRLHWRDRQQLHGLAITSPARTILDLAGSAESEHELHQAIDRARALRLVSDASLAGALARAPNRPGAGLLKAILAQDAGQGFTRSAAERRMRQIIGDAHLPQPLANARVQSLEVDFLWPEQRLVLEIDGYAFHGGRHDFERDRARDQRLVAAGLRVIRVTWRQLVGEETRVVATLAAALALTASA